MKFADTIQMDVIMGGETRSLRFHIGDGLDNLVILGTNMQAASGIMLRRLHALGTTEIVKSCNDTVSIRSVRK